MDWQPKNILNQIQQDSLIAEVKEDEIKDAIWRMKEGKAPGADGFTVTFLKNAWDIMGKDVICAVQHFFSFDRLLLEINATFISLIHKTMEVSKFCDFRPISLCNLLYKFITKIMSNMLQGVIGSLVSANQTAFIK